MYNLYFESCGRAKVVKLKQFDKISHTNTAEISVHNDKSEWTRLLCVCTESQRELLRIDVDNYLATITKVSDDKTVRLKSANIDHNTITLNFIDFEKDQKKIQPDIPIVKKEDLAAVEFADSEHKTSIIIKNNKTSIKGSIDDYLVIVKYGNYIGEIPIRCVPESQVYDVVLDFGSESTQMLIRRFDDDNRVEQHKIFNGVINHFYNISSVKGDRVYDQQDEEDTLFRSVFFKKKKGEMSKSFLCDPPSKDDSFFNFISSRRDSRGERIPNVKIAYLTGKNVEGTTKEQLHRGIILRFLHEAIMHIMEEENKRERNCPIAVRLTLLIPNVLPQKSTSELLKDLREKANSSLFKEHFKDKINIVLFEIRSCSESDASFLDWMLSKECPKTPGKRYLIVDVGKGTTDFSIVKVSDAHNVVSEYRAGFVGAGNAISYAIFQNYMHKLGGDKMQEITKTMLSAESALLYDLENIIEEYKHNWNLPISNKNISAITVMKPEVILDRIKELGQIGDSAHYVEKMAKKIADNIIDRLPLNMEIDYLVFSGRAFKFAMLREQIEKSLEEHFKKSKKNIKTVPYNARRAKNGCLYGPLNGINLSLESQMVGFPEIYDSTEQPLINKDSDTSYKEHIYASVEKITAMKENVNFLNRTLRAIAQIFADENVNNNSKGQGSHKIDLDKEIKLYMKTGRLEENINNNSVIFISGNLYKPEKGNMVSSNAPYNIYFDGENFYLRHKNECACLNVIPTRPEKELLEESMFPYSIND